MATYLELCQRVARESGVVSGTSVPSTVSSQTGTLRDIVNWVADSWRYIQMIRPAGWSWMRKGFEFDTTPGVGQYSASDMLLTDWGSWLVDSASYKPVYAFKVSDGQAASYPLRYIPYNEWRTRYALRLVSEASPVHYSVAPDGTFLIGPSPDTAYTVMGEYFQSPQTLQNNTDTPRGLDAAYHDIIAWQALLRLNMFDEAQVSASTAAARYNELLLSLELREEAVTRKGGQLA